MKRLGGLALLCALPLLAGCAAAVIPVVAGTVMAKKQAEKKDQETAQQGDPATSPTPSTTPTGPQPSWRKAGEPVAKAEDPTPEALEPVAVAEDTPVLVPDAAPAPEAVASEPVEMAVLLPKDMAVPEGVTDAPAAEPVAPPSPPARGAYAAFTGFALGQLDRLKAGQLETGMVLVDRFAIEKPRFMDCTGKAPAVIIDADDSFSSLILDGIAPVPEAGLSDNLTQLRAAGISVLWTTGLPARNIAGLSDRLTQAGLNPDGQDRIFALYGRDDRKELRRIAAATEYCVLAIVGDRKADAEEAYDYLRTPEAAFAIDKNWDAGWFLAPPPLSPAKD